MIIDKNDTSVAIITAVFTSSTGAGVAPGTSFKIQIYDSASTPAAKLTAGGESMAVLDSITGVYFYRWTVSSVAVGCYSAVFIGVDTAVSYPNAIDITVIDTSVIEGKIDTIDTNVDTANTNITALGLGMGAGNIAIPLVYKETNSNKPYAGVNVWLTTDLSGSILYTGKNYVTDSGGRITFFGQPNSTYYWWSALQDTPVATITTNNTAVV